MKKLTIIIAITVLSACTVKNKTNHYTDYIWTKGIETGISWPEGQLVPIFSYPAQTLDTIHEDHFNRAEKAMFGALQGIVNSEKPRILGIKWDHWIDALGFTANYYTGENNYEIIEKYSDYIKGIVLYDVSKSPHYINLASTIANLNEGYVPATQYIKDKLEDIGVVLTGENIIDISDLPYDNEYDIYDHLYANYWEQCSKRLLIHMDPNLSYPLRDIAAAAHAAIIHYDVRYGEGKQQFEKFLKDMAESGGTSVVMGWFTNEREGITAATKYGIPTLPGDFYRSASVYSGMSHLVNFPRVPKRDGLENKAYIALYMSDGDNVQYWQNFMFGKWSAEKEDRGKIALNWTMAPALVDLGPGLLNFFYSTTTDKECFVAGPSGIGYIMPYNSAGGNPKNYLTESRYADAFTKLTETYLHKSGIRVITIWDGASDMVRQAYERNCRNLYGLTILDWTSIKTPEVTSSTVNDRLWFDVLKQNYTSDLNIVRNGIAGELRNWDGSAPLFISYQLQSFNWDIRNALLVKMETDLREAFPEKDFEFVRADHYFSFYNEYNGMLFNLCMLESVKKTSTDTYSQFDFGQNYSINRYVIRHAESTGGDKSPNTRSWKVEASADGNKWSTVDTYRNNTSAVTDIDIKSVTARYVRITVLKPGVGKDSGIAEIEIYGKKI